MCTRGRSILRSREPVGGWCLCPIADLVAWYDAHSPADVSSAYAPSSSSPEPDGDLYWQIPAHSTSYSEPAAVVAYARLGPNTTAIRTDATLAARYDRTAQTLVPATVTSIDITKSAIDGPAHPPTTATVTDPALLTRITSAFNDLDGAFANTETQGCGSPVGIVYVYAVARAKERRMTMRVSGAAAVFRKVGRRSSVVELRGLEPLTFSLRTRRATNCATAPDPRSGLRRAARTTRNFSTAAPPPHA